MKREQQPLTSEFNIERFFFVKIKGVGNLLGKKVDLVKKGWLCELKEKKGQRNFFSRNCCYLKNWPWISSEKSSGYKEKNFFMHEIDECVFNERKAFLTGW